MRPKRKPDIETDDRVAWQVRIDKPQHVDHTATLACWLVKVPGAHPCWDRWTITAIHLRDIPGGSRPAHRRYPEATHEIIFLALDPNQPFEPDDESRMPYLTPADLVHQFHGIDDADVIRVVHNIVRAIVTGGLSPDGNNRRWWASSIDNTVACLARGNHKTN